MKVLPFKGILYNKDKVDIKDVVTLPYDKITPQQKSIYESKSPYNMVHLILPKTHKDAGFLFGQWLKDGVLIEDPKPAIYVYEQEYEYPGGATKKRMGFIALLELQPFGKDTIMPHERTFSKIVDDRVQLLDNTKANIEQIFILYSDKNINKLLNGTPRIDFKDEFGIVHRLWSISDGDIVSTIQDSISDAQLFIADGHHRYTASLLYKDKKGGDKFIMATLVDSNDSGLVILPTHRVLKEVPGLDNDRFLSRLKEYFIVEKGDIEKGDSPLFRPKSGFVEDSLVRIYLGGGLYYSLTLKQDVSLEKVLGLSRPRAWLYLGVNILHLLILKHIMGIDTSNMAEEANVVYLREEESAISMVDKGARVAFILNPTRIEEVKEIVSLGEVMPHKSTDFYPKLHSGLVMRKF